MSIDLWWPRLPAATRDRLVADNGDAVPDEVAAAVEAAGGPGPADPWWSRDEETGSRLLPDEAVDWVEATANGEDDQPS